MCGRFTLAAPGNVVAELFGLDAVPELRPRYNIAPTQGVAVVRADGARRRLDELRWGLVPAWAREPSIGSRLINARAETVGEKPAFRSAFRARRCLVVADGFYEWARGAGGKQPWYFRRRDGSPFAFAGLWERWLSPQGEPLESCALVTTTPNALVARVHDRMPVILAPRSHAAWLDSANRSGPGLEALLRPLPEGEMTGHAVGLTVNSPSHDSPACIAEL